MENLRLVAPITYTSENNSAIVSLLGGIAPPTTSGFLPNILIPINGSLDVDSIVQQNDKRTARGQGQAAAEAAGADEIDSEELLDGKTEQDPQNWRVLDAFAPTNRLEQINTVFLQDFPSLRKSATVRCFDLVLSACPLKVPKTYDFTFLSETVGRDVRGVFVRFHAIEVTRWVSQNIAALLPTVVAAFDPELGGNEAEQLSEASRTATAAEIAKIISEKKYYSHGTTRTGTEDLDEVMKYYRTYKVENSELVEVPKELKEVIVKDIMKFRSKVLTIERERRKREIEKERLRARTRLTLIYEGIKAAPVGGEQADVEMEQDETTNENELLNALTDKEYEEYIEKEKAKKTEETLQQKLHEIERLEQSEKAPLLSRLEKEMGYEENLIENKIVYMDEIKVFLELDVASAATCSNAKVKSYYTNYPEYMRLRNHERAREEEKDALDAKDAESEPLQSGSIIAKKPVEVKVKVSESSSAGNSTKAKKSIQEMPQASLDAIKEKISVLIEEYLGIKEELLIGFVYDFVFENGLESTDELIGELQETLDEDSQTVVNELHAYIETL
ncbi:hypothetical protein PUMCH_002871 [Australozyma saopauloensis]|uniref:Uncharacterized protein n=1 Tax=Australozyma saopauloensis TaxID=291208 RepID=A0AAX4HB84_9ASCO|nr:hypothetical protein PUMCH_002871 [[Candida] saopauloensis]